MSPLCTPYALLFQKFQFQSATRREMGGGVFLYWNLYFLAFITVRNFSFCFIIKQTCSMFLAMLKKTLSLKKAPCNGGKRRV